MTNKVNNTIINKYAIHNNSWNTIERFAFAFLLILAMAIIIVPAYYLTCDGPSHTYNAKIFFDYLLNHNREFYKNYFTVNRSLDPNWLSQIGLGLLIQFTEPRIAEKIFQCFLVASFAFGFRYLILSINKQNVFLSLLFYPFCFTLPFQTGFYNYCLGLALGLFLIGYYLKHRFTLQPINLLVFCIIALATTLSHGMAASNAILIIGILFIVDNMQSIILLKNKEVRIHLMNKVALMLLGLAPSILLILFFALKRGTGVSPHGLSKMQKLINYLQMYCSQSTRHLEMYPAVIISIVIYGLVAYYVIRNFKSLSKIFVAFALAAVFFFISYITCPQAIGGSGSIDIRLAFLPPMFLLVACSVVQWKAIIKYIVLGVALLCQITFIAIRWPHVMQVSKEQVAMVKAQALLKNNSSILTLHYNDYGVKNSFEKDNSFMHATDYLGTSKQQQQLIILNYEADLNYFAMNWIPNKNPRNTINNLYQGVYPPCGEVIKYEQQVNKPVDYISVLGKHNGINDKCTNEITKFIETNYICVYYDSVISNSSLWERKN